MTVSLFPLRGPNLTILSYNSTRGASRRITNDRQRETREDGEGEREAKAGERRLTAYASR